MDGLFSAVAVAVTASACLAAGLLLWRTRGLRRRLFLTLLAVALLPALAVGLATWQQSASLGRLADAPGLRESVDASVALARALLEVRAGELSGRAAGWSGPAGPTEPGPGWGWILVDPPGPPRAAGCGAGLQARLADLTGTGRLDDPPLLYEVVPLDTGARLIALRQLEPELAARVEAVGRGATGLRQLGLYYEQILRGRALLVAASVLLVSVLLALLVSGALTDRLVRPLSGLVGATRQVTGGERSVVLEPRGVDEVRELEVAFNEMTSQLLASEDRLRRSERLAAWQGIARRLAHEIKNPLTPIHLAVHRARRRSTDPVVTDALAAIEEETLNLQRLAEEFSALGRLPAPRRRPVDAAAVAREVAALYLPEQIRFAVTGEAWLDADEGQLRQVFSNLFKNAAEALGGRGTVQVRLEAGPESARLTIDDDGPGLPADAGQIFEPEFTTRSSGTGLGLAIVRRIVEDHGGRVEAMARTGGGARFLIEWPVAAGENSDG